MREHVVQFAGDAAPFGQGGRGGLGLAGVLELGQEQFGAVLALPAAPDELAGHRQQQAQQHGGEDRLGGLGQAHGQGKRDGDGARGGRGRDGWQPDRGDPDGHARRQLDRPVGLHDG